MQDQIVKIFEKFDRTGSSIRQASARSNARPQAFPPSRNDDRRHRTHASDPEGSVQTRSTGRQGQHSSQDLECGSRCVIQRNFPAPAWLDLKTFAPQPIKQGQTTSRNEEMSWYRAANAPTAPARRAAQNGCKKTFLLRRARPRRRRA